MTYDVMSSAPAHYIKPSSSGIAVTLPVGKNIVSAHTASLNILGLPPAAIQCNILPELSSVYLLYISLLCNNDCDAHFHFFLSKISFIGVLIITGP